MIEIDGSLGEGGGQVLRSSLTLSLLTGKPFRIRKIRARRKPKPGLQPQHLASVRAAAAIGHAEVSGDSINSSVVTFEPGPVVPGEYRFSIGTAGATGLVLQTIYLPLAWQATGPSRIVLEGGTHVSHSPSFHFLDVTWRAYLAKLGLGLNLEMVRPGFYPRGGGQVIATIDPCHAIASLQLTHTERITRARGFSAVAGLPRHVASRQASRAIERFGHAGIEVDLEQLEWQSGLGSVLGLTLDESPIPTFFTGLGARGKPAESVADEAVDEAIAFAKSGMPVDAHSADQIVLPLALANGPSELRVHAITRHLTTNIDIIRMFIERSIACDGEEGSPGVIRVAAR